MIARICHHSGSHGNLRNCNHGIKFIYLVSLCKISARIMVGRSETLVVLTDWHKLRVAPPAESPEASWSS